MKKEARKRRQKLLKMRLDGMTYAAIGTAIGISRQRVQQLLSPPKAIRDYVVEKFQGRCSRCGIYVGSSGQVHHVDDLDFDSYNGFNNLELLCLSCHRQVHALLFGLAELDWDAAMALLNEGTR